MNYKNHDKLGYITATSVIIISIRLGVPAWVFGPVFLGCLVGTAWLSPDLDLHHSKPSQRWGILKPIWKNYAKKNKHRGISHTPIIGSVTRWFYLFTRFFCLPLATIICVVINYPQLLVHLLLFCAGVELYCLSHIISDHASSLWERISR